MAIEQLTTIDQIEVGTEGGEVRIRYAKWLVKGEDRTRVEWHRATLLPGEDITAMIAAVDRSLEANGDAPVAEGEYERAMLRETVALHHTPEKVAAFVAEREARGAIQTPDLSPQQKATLAADIAVRRTLAAAKQD